MKLTAQLLVLLVALLHVWFMILEMFLWKKPLGMKVFRKSPQDAEITAVLAANQGLYNGFLAAGLITGLLLADPAQALLFQIFFLCCVVVAGLFGAVTASSTILFVQAAPAVLALIFVVMTN